MPKVGLLTLELTNQYFSMDGRKKNGGARKGAGRKSIHEEIAARDIAISAIVKVYGSLEDGMVKLLLSEEPSLKRFVFEHALGKPMEKVQHSTDPDNPVIFKIDGRFKDATGDNS